MVIVSESLAKLPTDGFSESYDKKMITDWWKTRNPEAGYAPSVYTAMPFYTIFDVILLLCNYTCYYVFNSSFCKLYVCWQIKWNEMKVARAWMFGQNCQPFDKLSDPIIFST